MLNNASFHSQNYPGLSDALWGCPIYGNSEIAVCLSSLPSPFQGRGKGKRGQPGLHTRSQASLLLELRLCLWYTAGLSVGSHPQSSHPLGWPSYSFDLSAKPRHSGIGPPVSRHPSIRKSRYFVNKSCQGLPMKTSQWDYMEVFSLSLSVKLVEQKTQLKPPDSS